MVAGVRERPSSAGQTLLSRVSGRRREVLFAAGFLALTVVLLGVYVARRGPLPGEDALYLRPLIPPIEGRWVNDLALAFIDLGSPGIALGAVVAFVVLLLAVGERTGAVLVLAASAIAPVNAVLKPLFGERPIQKLEPVAHYPSGHVAFVAAVYGMLALLALARARGRRGRARGRARFLLAATLLVPVVAIGPAVLIGGGHVASDVAGAYGLAAAWILVVLLVASRLRARDTSIG